MRKKKSREDDRGCEMRMAPKRGYTKLPRLTLSSTTTITGEVSEKEEGKWEWEGK